MNNKTIGWVVFTGWLLVIGIGILTAMTNDSHKDETEDAVETPASEVQSSVISYHDTSTKTRPSNHLTG